MTLTERTLPSHIVFDDQGRPWLKGTGRKIIEIAYDKRGGMTAEQIHEAHPDLPLAKIYAALSYYYDHQQDSRGTPRSAARENLRGAFVLLRSPAGVGRGDGAAGPVGRTDAPREPQQAHAADA
jgi:uncharacterized protein (DUF433 family)